MKSSNFGLRLIIYLALITGFQSVNATTFYWVSATPGNWSNAGNWSLSSGGVGGAGIPGAADQAIFNSARRGNCTIDIATVTLQSLTVQNGYYSTILISGNLTVASISVISTTLSTGTLILNGGSASFITTNVDIPVSGNTTDLEILQSSFTRSVNLISTAVVNKNIFANTFQQSVSISRNGPATMTFENNTFSSTVSLTNNHASDGLICMGAETYNGDLTVTNNATATVNLCYRNNTSNYNGNVSFSNTVAGTIATGAGPGGGAILAAGKTLTLVNNAVGTYSLAMFTQLGNSTPVNVTLTGTALLNITGSTFNSLVNLTVPAITNGGGNRFNRNFTLVTTGGGVSSLISTIFQQPVSITKNGTGALTLEANTYNSSVTVVNNNNANIVSRGAEVYNDDVSATNNSLGYILLAYAGATAFNGNIIVSNTSTGTIAIGSNSAGGRPILAVGKTLTLSDYGLGHYVLANFEQAGISAPFTFNLSGTAVLEMFDNTFNSAVTITVPRLICNIGNQFNQNFTLTTTGNGTSTLTSSLFMGPVNINRNGAGILELVENYYHSTVSLVNNNNTNNLVCWKAEVYNGDLTVTNHATSPVYLGYSTAVTTYNENVTLTNTSTGKISIGESNAGGATLADGKTLNVVDNATGTYSFTNLTQLGSSTPVNVTLSGSALLNVVTSTFNSAVNINVPTFNGSGNQFNKNFTLATSGAAESFNSFTVFQQPVNITRNGSGNLSLQNNRYNSTVSMTNNHDSGSIFCWGAEVYEGDITITNRATSVVYLGYSVAVTIYNGNVTLENTNTGGISVGASSDGGARLSATKTITLVDRGVGTYTLNKFERLGTSPVVVLLTGSAHLNLFRCIFHSAVDFTVPSFSGASGNLFNGNFTLKTTGGPDSNIASMVFQQAASITRNGLGNLILSDNTYNSTASLSNENNVGQFICYGAETHYGDVSVTNRATSTINLGYAVNVAEYKSHLTLSNISTGTIAIGASSGGGARLAAGKTLTLVNNATGMYSLNNFTQIGNSTPVLISLGGSSRLTLSNSRIESAITINTPNTLNSTLTGNVFNTNITVNSTSLAFNSNIVQGTASINFTGTGSSNNGGNTFNGAATITNSNSGTLSFGVTNGDTYNGNVSFVRTSGTLQPVYSASCSFLGNLAFNTGSSGLQISVGGTPTGIVRMEGSSNQTFTASGSTLPVFRDIVINKTGASSLILNSIFIVRTSLTLTAGYISSSNSAYMKFENASVTGASDASYIRGPVRKEGNQAFTFPVGSSLASTYLYRPIAISAPSLSTEFSAEYIQAHQPYGGEATYTSPLVTVSGCDYWILNRTIGTSNVAVTLSWNSAQCTGDYISDLPALRVARWNGTNWVNHGNGGTTGNAAAGTITSGGTISSFSPFTIASTLFSNPLPIELLSFSAEAEGNKVNINWKTSKETNTNYFHVQRRNSGGEFETIGTVAAAGNSDDIRSYQFQDEFPNDGVSYYILKTVDLDGSVQFSKVVMVESDLVFSVYPNPATSEIHLTKSRSFQLLDSMGAIMMKSISPVNNISLPDNLAAGIYFLITDKGEKANFLIYR